MSARWVIGVDIGGTNTVVAVIPFQGGLPAASRTFATRPRRGGDPVVEEIGAVTAELVEQVLAEEGGTPADVLGVGIGCPGPLDLETGVVGATPNLGWEGYPIRDRVGDALGLPASLDNDANCATYGEWWQGVGRGTRSLVGVTLGTGVGGGFIEQGRLLRGASGSACELGHTTIELEGRRCRCGNRGCLEAYTSGPNIAARAREGLDDGVESRLPDLVDGDLDRITAATLYEALELGDDYAQHIMTETARLLGVGLANVVNMLNPEMIVVVGGVTKAGNHLFHPLRAEVRRRAFGSAVDACRIVAGALPSTAGVIGAAGVFVMERRR